MRWRARGGKYFGFANYFLLRAFWWIRCKIKFMKKLFFVAAAMLMSAAPVLAVNVSSAGVNGADGGILQLDQTDPYWWFCVQPDGSRGPLSAGAAGYTADVVSLDYGWTRQTTERFTYAGGVPPNVQADLGLHVNVIEYLLDTYLPWNATTDRFLEFAGQIDQNANNDFLNRFYAVHAYVKELFLKPYADTNPNGPGFTDLSLFDPANPYTAAMPTAAEIARRDFFNTMKAEVRAKDVSNDFESYDPMHQYFIVNTFQSQASPLDWQDALIIGGAVPEPSVGLLAVASVLALVGRRRRR